MTSPIAMNEWESKSALLAHMDTTSARTALVGAEAESPRKFYSFSLSSGAEASEVAVLSSGFGTKPEVVLLDSEKIAIVGHDAWLTWIDIHPLALISSQRLNGAFYEFIPLERDDQVVVLHELGILRVDTTGTQIWAVDTDDVVEQSNLDGKGNVILTVMDRKAKLVVSLESGKVREVPG